MKLDNKTNEFLQRTCALKGSDTQEAKTVAI